MQIIYQLWHALAVWGRMPPDTPLISAPLKTAVPSTFRMVSGQHSRLTLAVDVNLTKRPSESVVGSWPSFTRPQIAWPGYGHVRQRRSCVRLFLVRDGQERIDFTRVE